MPAVIPTSVAARPTAPTVLLPEMDLAASPEIYRVLQEVARLDLYATNPCRTLGVFPAVETPVLVDRVQALLGEGPAPAWAFAPQLPLSAEQLRRAGQAADGVAARMMAELFWFWPAAYPQAGADAALTALLAGDAEAAYGLWLAAQERGETVVSGHNIAVMFHHAALERELERGPLDEGARAWWTAAADHWTAVLAVDDFWAKWAARWESAAGEGTAVAAVGRVREELPRLLAQITLQAAVERARRGEVAEARWLRELAGRTCAAPELLERSLAAVLDIELERAGAAVVQAEERLTADDAPCLKTVTELLRQLDARRRVIEGVAGPDSLPLRWLGNRTIEAGLAGLVEHARRTQDEAAVLPWLLYLSGWPAGPDERRRLATVCGETWERLIAAALGIIAGPETRAEAVLHICSGNLVPAVEQFAWDERVQAAYRQRVLQRLRELAREAWRESGDFEVTAQACVLAAELCDEETSTLVVREKRQLWQQFQRAQNGALTLEFNGSKLEIDSHRLRFDGREWALAALNGVRYGVSDGLGGEGPQVAWYAGRDAVVLDTLTWFDSVDGGAERYRQVVEALEACVAPALAARIVERVRAGQSVVFGQSALRPEGFVFRRRPGQPEPDTVVPYAQLTQRVEAGHLVLGRLDDPSAEARYALAAVWNAVAMSEALTCLAEQV